MQKREEPGNRAGSPTHDILSAPQPVFLGATGRTLVGVSQGFSTLAARRNHRRALIYSFLGPTLRSESLKRSAGDPNVQLKLRITAL